MRLITVLIHVLTICLGGVSFAGLYDKGLLFGENHAFLFTAPKGWVMDNQSGAHQGLHMVFYPADETWTSSPVIAYGRSRSKTEKIKSVEDQVNETVNQYRKNGSPNYQAEKKPSIELPEGKEAQVYYFEGDQWGNYEAAGYIEEKETINFLVFNARTKNDFEINKRFFYDILRSYKDLYEPETFLDSNDELYNRLLKQAGDDAGTPEGKAYETKIIKSMSGLMASAVRDCSSFLRDQELDDFEAFMQIEQNGGISGFFIKPANGLTTCFKSLVSTNTAFPHHSFDSFTLHLNMKIKK